MNTQPKTATAQEIHEVFELFKKNMDIINMYEELLYADKDEEKWIDNYKKRSEATRKAYADNTRVSVLLAPFFADPSTLTDDVADALYAELIDLGPGPYDDAFIAVKVINLLITYYRQKNNLSRLILLYNRLGYEAFMTFRMGCKQHGKLAYDSYIKVISYAREYASFTDFYVRRAIFVAYSNLITSLPSYDLVNIDDAFDYYDKVQALYKSDEVTRLDGDAHEIKEIMEYIRENILGNESLIPNASEEAKKRFCTLAREVYKEQCEKAGSEYKIDVIPLLANYSALYIEGRCGYTDAVEYLLAYYKIRSKDKISRKPKVLFAADEEFNFNTQLPQALIFGWLKDRRVDDELRKRETRNLIDCVNKYYSSVSRKNYTPFMNRALTDWCFRHLCLLDSFEEKESTIFNVILHRQIQTFFHSHMVAYLARMITDSVLENMPELLLPIYNLKSTDELYKKADDLRLFIKRAALYHDIGKTRMPNIINMQYRRLTAEELEIIRQHPGMGADAVDEDFDDYHAIILGHHKYYDGETGYPPRFSTKGLRVKPVIDLITICDTLDAATDYYGRNYAIKKSFPEVLEEMHSDSVNHYNPQIVSLLYRDKKLYNAIDALLTHGREEAYYKLIKENL